MTGIVVLHTHCFRFDVAEFPWLCGEPLCRDPPDNPDVSRVAGMSDLKFMSNDDDLRWLTATDPKPFKLLVRGLLPGLLPGLFGITLISPERALCKGLVALLSPVVVFDPDVADV